MNDLVKLTTEGGLAALTLNDPSRRNALSMEMFNALDDALARIAENDGIRLIVLRGAGPAFCAGFDLAAAAGDHRLLPLSIVRLSGVLRAIRRLPQIVMASVHGAAIAGGCALVSACDIVIVSPDAKLGYPVHALGISPAVTIPTLAQALGTGSARALLLAGRLIDGREAAALGLAHRVASNDDLVSATDAFCRRLLRSGAGAQRVTKRWLNDLDGSLDDAKFARPADGSASAADSNEARKMLEKFWTSRTAG